MYILHTVLHTYPKAMARRICLTIRSFLSLRFFSLFKGDTVGRNKFDLGTGGGVRGGSVYHDRWSPLYTLLAMTDSPSVPSENHVIPSKILLFPPPPLPAPLMRNNDWSSTVTLSFSLHNVSREMFL